MDNVGTFILSMEPCEVLQLYCSLGYLTYTNLIPLKPGFLIRPDLLAADISDEKMDNQDIIAQLKEAHNSASQRKVTLEHLRWGADALNGIIAVGELVEVLTACSLNSKR